MRLAVLAILAFSHTTFAQIQRPNLQQPSTSADYAASVKGLFQSAYGAYVKGAFGSDTLTPITNTPNNDHHGWGLTIIASMSTMYVMGLNDLFANAVAFVATVDFSKVPADSPVVTISDTSAKYLGGLLSAYELSQKKNPILLQKAQQLGDKLAYAWVNGKDIPFNSVNFVTNAPTIDKTINIADATGMLLEFDRLSYFTGNTTYYDLAKKAVLFTCKNPAPLHGLPAQMIDPNSGAPVGGYVSFGDGNSDYYYGLLRITAMQIKDSGNSTFRECWKSAVDTAMTTLVKTSAVGGWTYLADFDDEKKIRYVSSQLACFAGGDWILGGRLFNNITISDKGQQLTDSCINTYTSTGTNLGPETFAFISSDGDYTGGAPPTYEQRQFSDKTGFYITNSAYLQRPEVPQSIFYAWRAFGDVKYVDLAESILMALITHTQKPFGMVGLSDVMNPKGDMIDYTDVSFFSGVLKYLYLIFDDPHNYSLDKYIWSMEGHPFAL